MLEVSYGSWFVQALKCQVTGKRVETSGDLVEMSRKDS